MPSPKKKSPSPKGKKDSPKNSKKNSPKGKAGGKGEAAEPPREISMQTEPNNICYACRHEFQDAATIQAHLCLMDHMPPYSALEQLCRACKNIIPLHEVEHHKCIIVKASYFRLMMSPVVLKHGPPNRCLFCRGMPCHSRVELALHLLCHHAPRKELGKCGMCNFTYNEQAAGNGDSRAGRAGADKGKGAGGKKKSPPKSKKSPNKKESKSPQSSPGAIVDPKQVEKEICEPTGLERFEGLVLLDKHIVQDHLPVYQLVEQMHIIEESRQRQPYTCPLCGYEMKDNIELHVHVLGAHNNINHPAQDEINTCGFCLINCPNPGTLNCHLMSRHAGKLPKLAALWIKHELMMNVSDPNDVCSNCWRQFKNDFQLQAHLIVSHTHRRILTCGWCNMSYLHCPNKEIAYNVFKAHEKNHSRNFHAAALAIGNTYEPVPPLVCEEVRNETLEERAARLALEAEAEAAAAAALGGAGGKKSPGKKSPGKKSPNKKSPGKGSPKAK